MVHYLAYLEGKNRNKPSRAFSPISEMPYWSDSRMCSQKLPWRLDDGGFGSCWKVYFTHRQLLRIWRLWILRKYDDELTEQPQTLFGIGVPGYRIPHLGRYMICRCWHRNGPQYNPTLFTEARVHWEYLYDGKWTSYFRNIGYCTDCSWIRNITPLSGGEKAH